MNKLYFSKSTMRRLAILLIISLLASIAPACLSVSYAADGYMITGTIEPDFKYDSSLASTLKSGFKVEVDGTSITAETNSDGIFVLKNVPRGNYSINISKRNYLTRTISNISINNMDVLLLSDSIKIWPGDMQINGTQDGSINMADIIEIAKFFDSVYGDSRYSEYSDINCDKQINMADLMAVCTKFNLTKDKYEPITPLYVEPSFVNSPSPTQTVTQNTSTPTPIRISTDWSVKLVDSTMSRTPKMTGWGYWNGFYLSIMYRVYLRTNDAKYLNYMKAWADSCVDNSGNIKTSVTSLDLVQPGLVLLYLYKETKLEKYKTAATKIRKIIDTYPRTKDGGFWHMIKGTSANPRLGIGQLWLDGTYMSTPFLVTYGSMFNDSTYCNNEAANQLLIYASHLRDPKTGLLYHAYDEDGSESWADPVTHHSPDFWGRSIGWYGMAMIEVLECLPEDHPKRAEIISVLQELIAALAKYQSSSGLWYQVVNKGTQSGNWLESSCSCMYTYTISKAIEKGYVNSSYSTIVEKGIKGVLTKISLGSNGLTNVTDICVGTDVGDYNYYINRKKATNDTHGLGAFLVCFEQVLN